MGLRRLYRREKIILIFALFVTVVGLMVNFLIAPATAKLKKINKEIENKASLLERYFYLKNKGKDIISLYENYNSALEKVSLEERTANFFEEIE